MQKISMVSWVRELSLLGVLVTTVTEQTTPNVVEENRDGFSKRLDPVDQEWWKGTQGEGLEFAW